MTHLKKMKLLPLLMLVFAFTSCNEYPDLEDGLYAKFNTNHGEFLLKLYYDKKPITVGNFVALAEGNHPDADEKFKGKPFYDGLKFHRIIDGFMIQGGDPEGTGQGSAGYKFNDEFDSSLTHDKGVISMANSGPNTNGSQFFITVAPTKHLDGRHSIFGEIAKGEKVVDSIGKVETTKPGDKPVNDVIMEKVEIIRIGKDAKNFDAPQAYKGGLEAIKKEKEAEKAKVAKTIEELKAKMETTESGLMYYIEKENPEGKQAEVNKTVKVHYAGYLTDGTKFDSSFDRGQPISFRLGTGRVIKGWDEGVELLKEGETAHLLIPSDIAYGSRQRGPIPANATLYFKVKLVEIVDN